jgi:hypothetical protein
MKGKRLFIILGAIIALVVIGIFVLPTDKTQKIDKAFTPYVSAYTSGVISNQSAIRVMLMEDMAGAEPNKPVEIDLFSFKPKIKGQAYWIDSRTVEFRPAEKLPSGTSYKATFDLDKVMEVPDDLKDFEFNFQTLTQSFEAEFQNIRAYNKKDLQWQQISGMLKTADFASPEEVKEMLEATQNNKKLHVTWQHDADGMEHIFTIDSVARTDNKGYVVLNWDGSSLGSKQGDEQKIEIPALGDFDVVKVRVVQQPEQYASLVFSDPLSETQNLQGLVRLKSGTSVRHVIDENEIKLYPNVRQTGTATIIIEKSVKNSLGYKLGEKLTYTLRFESVKPEVELIGKGNILPNSDGLIFPFKAVSLKSVNVRIIKIFENNIHQFFQVNNYSGDKELKRVGRIVYNDEVQLTSNKPIDLGEWNTFYLDLSELINAEPGAIYRVQINFEKDQTLFPCPDEDSEEDEEEYQDIEDETNPSDENYWSYYGYNQYNYYDGYNWSERNDPCKKSYYMRYNKAVEKNILASNLGITAKKGKTNQIMFIVNDLISTDPVSGVSLKVYNFQKQLIQTAQTDGNGIASVDITKKPYFLVAEKDGQFGYLRLDDGSSLSLSMFNVSGREAQKGLKGYIYGERGVWRPGDSLFLSFFIEDKNNHLPKNHPVVLDLINPKGQVAERKVTTRGKNGLYVFRLKTEQDDPTGNYTAKVKVGGATFEKTIKIETIKPNRLKIDLDFGIDMFTKSNINNVTGDLEVKWLHGAVARNLKTQVDVTIAEAKTKFDDYPGYHFNDPASNFHTTTKRIFTGSVNENGQASVSPSINLYRRAPGMLNFFFRVRAYETSGNFSTDRFKMPYSPYPAYVGVNVPKGEGWGGAIISTKPHDIALVTVDENGKPVSRNNLIVEVYKIKWRWWWERNSDDNLARYLGTSSHKKVHTGSASTRNGKGIYQLKLDEKFWGRALVRITDPVSGHKTGQIIYMTWPGWSQEGLQQGGASMLTFTTNKQSYNVGEEVIVNMPSSEGGRAFVSLESGSKVLEGFWVSTQKKQTEFKFKVTPDMAPNVYVYISLLQPHNQTKNDLPIRLYGVQPIKVEDPATHLHPEIDMPDELAPNEEVTIKISEKDKKAMNYTVAVVDEGLLDITGFKTPDPWSHFFARDALGVKTWDMYDYVIGAFAGEFAGLLEIGGGMMEAKKDGGEKANRFKPVVKFFGPFHLKSGRTNKHSFVMPNYIGSVKTMVVACDQGKYGSADKVTPVKKPLMVFATLPRVLGPEETIKLPVTVFAMDDKVKNVKVTVESDDLLIAQGATSQKVRFSQTGDQTVTFDYKVAADIGSAKLKVIATAGGEKATYDVELNVRAPNPMITNITDASVTKGQKWSASITPVGIKGTNDAVLEVSKFMPMNLEERLDFLIRYPYGCIEQTTSSVFPQLYVDKLVDLSKAQKDEIQNNIKAGINRLMNFQTTEGGFGYWPGASYVSEWGTNYASHFLIEAQRLGYDIPVGMLNNVIRFQKKAARRWSKNYPRRRFRDMMQSYRLYILALAEEAEMGSMNRLKEDDKISTQGKWRLALAYYVAGKSKAANEIISGLSTDIKPYRSLGRTFGSDTRDMAMILETLTLMGKDNKAKLIADKLAKSMGSGRWYSTQTTAYSLMALAKFVGQTVTDEPINFTYSINGSKTKKAVTKLPIIQIDMEADKVNDLEMTNNGSSTLFVRVIQQGIPATDNRKSGESDLQMTVRYLDLNNREIDPVEIEQGKDFFAEVSIKHPGIMDDYQNMALTQIFPSGWEIHNARMEGHDVSYTLDEPTYQDIRDDRVNTFFDLKRYDRKVFRVKLNAAYLGTYYLPTVYCEAMYDKDINARKAGKWVKVVLPGK